MGSLNLTCDDILKLARLADLPCALVTVRAELGGFVESC
jgi:hypothetical protein